MSKSNSRNFSYLILYALFSVFAYVLIELIAQYIFPATYNAQFAGLAPHEVIEIEAEAQKWNNSARPVNARVSKGKASGSEGYVDLNVSMNLIDHGFSTLATFVSNSELSDYGGALTFSREPNPLGQKLALLGSTLLFLVLLKGLIAPKIEREHH